MNGVPGFVFATLAVLLGLLLVIAGRRIRNRRGLANAHTVDLDRRTLISHRYGLVGRPDRLYQEKGVIIPEEWKSSQRLQPWHIVQLGVYFLLVEEHYRSRPPFGYVVCGDGTRHQIINDERLRASVLDLAHRIRRVRLVIGEPIRVRPAAWQCRPCGMRGHCGQARL